MKGRSGGFFLFEKYDIIDTKEKRNIQTDPSESKKTEHLSLAEDIFPTGGKGV